MTVTKDKVISMNYTLKDKEGQVLDASNGQPLDYLQGHSNIIPGLEQQLDGLDVGESKEVVVPPTEAYGEYNPQLKFAIPKEQFGEQEPQPGQIVQLSTPEGQVMVQVVEVGDAEVTLDANHPLAGKELHFNVEITAVRDASETELANGRPEGL